MKTILPLFLLFFTAFAHCAEVTVSEAGRVLIDGSDVGDVASAARNNLATPEQVQAALLVRLTSLAAAKTAAETALAETQAFAAQIIASAKAILAEGGPDMAARLTAQLAKAETPAQVRKRLALEAEKARVEAEQARIEAEIAKLP